MKDDYTGTNYNRQESSDGNQVTGEYRVQLPDGRMQIVTYYADWQTGFHADVRYEGTATYPETYKTNNGYQQGGISNQYGTPTGFNNDYNNNNGGGHTGASSSVSINNLSGPGAPYNVNNNLNNNNHNNNGYNYNNPNNNYKSNY